MVGPSSGSQVADRVLQLGHVGDQGGVRRGGGGKAHHADAAPRADLALGRTAGGLGQNVDERVGALLKSGQRRTRHTLRTVQHQHHVCGVGEDIRLRGQGQANIQATSAGDRINVNGLV